MKSSGHRFIVGLIAALPCLSVGQTALSGRAVDRAGVPLQGVSVSLQASGNKATTDASGRFVLSTPSDGLVRKAGSKSGLHLTAGARPDQFVIAGSVGKARISVRNVDGGTLPGTRTLLEDEGVWRIQVPEQGRGAGSARLFFISIESGSGTAHWVIHNGRISTASNGTRAMSQGLEKSAAWSDTLVFAKYGYIGRKIRITNPVPDLGDFQLPYYSGPGDSLLLRGYESYLRTNDWVRAVEAFTELGKRHSGTPNAHSGTVYLGKTHYATENYAAAVQTLNGYLAMVPPGPDAADALYYRGRSHYQTDAFPAARSDFAKVRTDYPASAEADGAAYYHAKTWYQEKAYAQALTEFQAFPLAYPASGLVDFALLNAGKSQMRLAAAGDSSRYFQAMIQFRKVLALVPLSPAAPAAQENLGECHYFLGRFDSARIELAKVEAAFPGHGEVADAVYYLGRCDVQQNLFDAALARFRRVFKEFPASAIRDDAHFQIGKTLFLAGRAVEAIPSLKETRQLYPLSSLGDNVSLYLVRSYITLPDCVAAKAEMADMRSRFPASPLLPLAQSSLTTGCP